MSGDQRLKGREEEARTILLFALQREDGLISNRLMWVLSFQGMLFAAVALAIRDNGTVNPSYTAVLAVLGCSLSVMGMFLSMWANDSISAIRKKWNDIPGVLGDVSPFGSGGHGTGAKVNRVGLSVAIPAATALAWAAIFAFAMCSKPCNNAGAKAEVVNTAEPEGPSSTAPRDQQGAADQD